MFGGTRSASAVSHQIPNSATPTPSSRKMHSTSGTGRPSANAASDTGHGSVSSIPMRIGWRGRQAVAERARALACQQEPELPMSEHAPHEPA
jgi:hypothetical protein